jgi:hypothetical protein
MSRKTSSIFKALDGAHLDGSIFDAQLPQDRTGGKRNTKSEPTPDSGRRRFWSRRAASTGVEDRPGKTRSDPGL